MKVQPCPACGARYNVERLSEGATFECRRCRHAVRVGDAEPPAHAFAPGPLAAGVFMLLGLLLYANPQFGFRASQWPWELVHGDAPLATKATILLWALAGLWGLVSAVGIAPRSRSVLTAGLAFALLLLCTLPELGELRVDTDLVALVAMIALGSGLLLLRDVETVPLARVLAFGGGLLIAWAYAFSFREQTPTLVELVRDVRALFGSGPGSGEVTQVLLPRLVLLAAGFLGVLLGLGAGGRRWAGTGLTLLLVFLLLPSLADLVDALGEEAPRAEAGRLVAEHGTAALVSSGLALWLLASHAIADLARNRKDPSR